MFKLDGQQFLEDYASVQQQADKNVSYNKHNIQRFFEYDYSVPLIDTTASHALNTLVDFIVSSLLPPDGAWVSYELQDSEELDSALKAKKILTDRLTASNFYEEITKTIRDGLLYGLSLIHI